MLKKSVRNKVIVMILVLVFLLVALIPILARSANEVPIKCQIEMVQAGN